MRKTFFLILFLIFTFLIFIPKKVFSQGSNNIFPYLDCGWAGAEDGKDKCCIVGDINLPDAPNLPQGNVFGAIDKYNQIKDSINKLQSLSKKACLLGEPSTDITDPNCKCVLSISPTEIPNLKKLCERYLKGDERTRCENCIQGGALWTQLGCVPLTVTSLINDYLLKIGVGLGGVLALLCIVYAAIQIQLSQGSAEKIKKAQELLTSCIMGLMLIIFSVFILRLIGVDILRMPGLR